MFKTLQYGFKVFQIYYRSNGAWAIIETFNRLYGETFFPLIQVYLLSKLLDLLATGQSLTFSDITWMVAFYLGASILKVLLYYVSVIRGAGYEFSFGDYIEMQIDKKLNDLDPAVFESTKFQNLLAQMNGVKGSMFSYLDRMLRLISSFVLLITAIIVVSTKFPIFVPIIILSIIPLFISMNKHRDDIWIYMSHERGLLERLFQYVRVTFSAPATSKEVAIFKNGPALMDKFKRAKSFYYNRFEKAYHKSLFILILSGLIQMSAFVITQAINLAAVFAGKFGIGQFTLYFQQTRNLASGAEGVLDPISKPPKYLLN